MSSNDVKALFSKENGFNFEDMIDYNSQYYIVKATRDGNNTDPYYSVNKKTLAVAHFSPMSDLSVIEKFKKLRS